MRVAASILAAEAGSPSGQPSHLRSFDGQPVVRLIAEAALDSTCDDVAVVVGVRSDETREALRGLPSTIVPNLDWPEGIASSVRAAVAWARSRKADALLLATCDRPRLAAGHLDRLARSWRSTPDVVVASRYGGRLGAPAIFVRSRFSELATLFGDEGPQRLLRTTRVIIAIDWPDGEVDVDDALHPCR